MEYNPVNPRIAAASHVQIVEAAGRPIKLIFSRHAHDGSLFKEPLSIEPPEELARHGIGGNWHQDFFAATRTFPGKTNTENGLRCLKFSSPYELDPVGTGAIIRIYSRDLRAIAASCRDEHGILRNIIWSTTSEDDKLALAGIPRNIPRDTAEAYARWLLETAFHPFAMASRIDGPEARILTVA